MPRKVLIDFRRDTAANWTGANPTLADGEPGWERDTGKLKIGDGSSDWVSLPYYPSAGASSWGLASTADLRGSGSPVGVVTPAGVGDLYVDDTTPGLWQATGLTNTDWTQLGAGGGGGGGSGGTLYFNKPAGNITRASATLGAFSTAWQITGVVVAAGQNVRLRVDFSKSDAGADQDYIVALYRGGTLLADRLFNSPPAAFGGHLEWIDEDPGAGTYTYEVRAAIFGGATLTVFQTSPTTDVAGGASVFVAEVSTPGSGDELDYVERNTALTVTATAAVSADVFINGNAVTYDGSTRVKIEFFCPYAGGDNFLAVDAWDGSTDLGVIAQTNAPTGASLGGAMFYMPTAGSHTFHIKAWRGTTSGDLDPAAGGAGTRVPAFMRITRA